MSPPGTLAGGDCIKGTESPWLSKLVLRTKELSASELTE